MKFSLTDYLILYGVIVTLLAVSYLRARRGSRQPVKLRLKKELETPPTEASSGENGEAVFDGKPDTKSKTKSSSEAYEQRPRSGQPLGWDNYSPRSKKHRESRLADVPRERSLNVMFNWNGHSWDAYEVLGVPAGSSAESAQEALDRARQGSDPETIAFLQAACEAILKHRPH